MSQIGSPIPAYRARKAVQKTVKALVNGDRAGELNETFMVNVGLASGNAVLGDTQGAGTIVDDEPRVSIASVTKNEGNSGTT